jgi:hypothetical protein
MQFNEILKWNQVHLGNIIYNVFPFKEYSSFIVSFHPKKFIHILKMGIHEISFVNFQCMNGCAYMDENSRWKKIIHVEYCPKFCIHYGQQDSGVGENYITIEFFCAHQNPYHLLHVGPHDAPGIVGKPWLVGVHQGGLKVFKTYDARVIEYWTILSKKNPNQN